MKADEVEAVLVAYLVDKLPQDVREAVTEQARQEGRLHELHEAVMTGRRIRAERKLVTPEPDGNLAELRFLVELRRGRGRPSSAQG